MSPKHSLAFAAALLLSAPVLAQQPQLPDSPIPNAPAATKPETTPQPESSSSSNEALPGLPRPAPRIATNPDAEITVLEDTLLRVRTNAPLSTSTAREGASLLFTLSEDVAVNNVLIIPRGATVHGIVVQSKKAGTLTGTPDLILKLTSLDLAGRNYPVYSYQFKVEGISKSRPTATKIKTGAAVGALVGTSLTIGRETASAVEKLATIATGAALGAGIGTAAAAASSGPSAAIPAEAELDFYLASPISVQPPTANEAEQLSHRLHTGEPILYVHGETP
jgi:hypothetical protein